MDHTTVNTKLSLGEIDQPRLFPHLDNLKEAPIVFDIAFGLDELPTDPGILLIRGARQYGKSTWLEQNIYNTIKHFGPGTAFYLNGDNILNVDRFESEVDILLGAFAHDAQVRRIFVDEITAIPNWELALKRMADDGRLKNTLVITTGSKATDLRRGGEKLPGRKGKLPRTTYLFTPISYHEFHQKCSEKLDKNTLDAYLLSGGSPIACSELALNHIIPEYVIELVRDWVDGEIALSGRNKQSLFNIMEVIQRFGGTPTGQAKLARESGLSNNTVAQGYIELLNDLGCVAPSYPWDQHKKIMVLRKQCKYHFSNLLVATTYNSHQLRCPDDFRAIPEGEQAMWHEWLVAQEIQRRNAIKGKELLAPLAFWQNKQHEIDFVANTDTLIEVKRGKASPIEFAWFTKQFPGKHLIVICANRFNTKHITGITLEDFLLEK